MYENYGDSIEKLGCPKFCAVSSNTPSIGRVNAIKRGLVRYSFIKSALMTGDLTWLRNLPLTIQRSYQCSSLHSIQGVEKST